MNSLISTTLNSLYTSITSHLSSPKATEGEVEHPCIIEQFVNQYASEDGLAGGLEGELEPTPQLIAIQTPKSSPEEVFPNAFERSYASLDPKDSNEPLPACLQDRSIVGAGRPHGYNVNGVPLRDILPENLRLAPLHLENESPNPLLLCNNSQRSDYPAGNNLIFASSTNLVLNPMQSPQNETEMGDIEDLPGRFAPNFPSSSTSQEVALRHAS